MDRLFDVIEVVVYTLLAMLAAWGAYCAVIAWRRVSLVRFRSDEHHTEFLEQMDRRVRAGDWSGAEEYCSGDRRAMPQLAAYAISRRDLDQTALRRQVADRFQREVLTDLDYRLSWVSTIVKAAPMVGLLGTVMGMMGAFTNLASGSDVDPQRMAEDIGFALITTACGLGIAIPLVLCSAAISVRLRKLEESVSAGVAELLHSLQAVLPARRREAFHG
ncbi:MAG: MotA/TolQ/ExbB proton channel family protein [Pirellulales bacterium]